MRCGFSLGGVLGVQNRKRMVGSIVDEMMILFVDV